MKDNFSSGGGFNTMVLYIFITALLGYLTAISSAILFNLGETSLAYLFIVVCIAHIGLYWLNSRISKTTGWWIFYYAAQVTLITAIAVITRGKHEINISLFESAIICIVGETLGWWGNSRRTLAIGGGFVLLAVALLYLLNDRGNLFSSLSGILINGGFIVLLMILFNQQLYEREKATELAESLEGANAKLAAYNARIESLTLQNERQRMARELHDTLAQGVAGHVLQLEAIKAHLAADRTERAAAVVETAIVRARNTLAESRAAIDDLRAIPTDVKDAAHQKVERFKQSAGIPCEVEISVNENQLPAETTDHALSILGEALANILRHARASQVRVKFYIQRQTLELEVCDNGIGFDVTHNTSGHYGLVGMHERARLTGGTLTIESNADGTCVQFTVGRSG